MRFKEFKLDEKIDFGFAAQRIGDEIQQGLIKWLITTYTRDIKNFNFYQDMLDSDRVVDRQQRQQEEQQDLSALSTAFMTPFKKLMSQALKNNGIPNVQQIEFANMDAHGSWSKYHGQYEGVAYINLDLYNKLINAIYDEFRYHFFDSGYEETINFRHGLPANIFNTVNEIITVLVHEAAHSRQSFKLKSPWVTRDYRSYAVNVKKFHDLLGKKEYTPEYYRAYNSSPQEIAAFAVDTVYKMLSESGINVSERADSYDLEQALELVGDFIQGMKSGGLAQYVSWPKDPLGQKVYRRFYKRVYEELVNIQDNVKSRLDQLKAAEND